MKNDDKTNPNTIHPFNSIGRRLSLPITLACITLAILISLIYHNIYKKQCIVAAGNTALAIAKTLASTIDGDSYVNTLQKEEKDAYWNTVKAILDKTHTDTETAFVYTFSHGDPDYYKYFASAHYDVEVGFTQHKTYFAKEVEQTLKNGAFTISNVYDAGKDDYADYGYLISGFAPIRNKKNEVVGAVGVDMRMDETLAKARTLSYALLAFLAVFSTAIGAYILWQTKRSIMRPLAIVTEASGRLADGDTDLKELPIERNDEIGLLARHFNQVARSVNSLTVGFIGSAESMRNAPSTHTRTPRPRGSHVPTAGLAGKYLATAQGINMVLNILDTLDCMVYVVDPETYRFIFYSKKFAEYYGIDRDSVQTQRCWEAIGNQQPCSRCAIDQLKMSKDALPSCEHEEVDSKNGDWLRVKNWLIHWFDGRVVYLSEGRVITEVKRWQEQQAAHEKQLRESTRAAQEANRMKTAFLANMSHEIRTPLNGVIGFAELAMEEPGTPEKTRGFLGKITDSGEALLQLINDILDVSKIETGKVELENIPFAIHDVFQLCETITQPKALEKGIELHFYEEPLVERQLSGDPTKLRQVLLNLISNAIKFTASGAIKVKCLIKEMRTDSVLLHFEVKDEGIGMTPEQVKNIFKPFTQADSSITRKYGGTGLGLSISRSFVDMMGGELSVQSEPGKGSTFIFTVPVRMSDAPAGAQRKHETTVIHTRPVFDGVALVCEDNQINREVIEEHLRRVGLRTVMAENGKIGVSLVRERMDSGLPPFSVIFMDIHMPHMDGLEATRILRRMNVVSPIVALTANVMTTERERYIREGMADCLGKPFSSKKLWRCLLRFLTPVRLENEAPDRDAGPGPESAGIDRSAGLANAANNPDLYERQLRRFATDQQDFSSRLAAAQAAGDRKTAHRLAHTMKGLAALIGADALSKAALEVERSLAEDAPESGAAALGGLFAALDRELRAVLEEVAPLAVPAVAVTPAVAADPAEVRELFMEVIPLLRSGDSAALGYGERLAAVLAAFGDDGKGVLAKMEDYDFDGAADDLEVLLGGM